MATHSSILAWRIPCTERSGLQSMGFSRQGYWNGLPCPRPGDLPDPGIEPMFLKSPALVGGFFTVVPPGYTSILKKKVSKKKKSNC